MSDKPNVLVTPKATVFGWVSIVKPDTKYNPEGDYKIRVRIPSDAKGLSEQLELIEKARADAKAAFAKEPKNKGKRIKEADLPFYEDDDGFVVMSFKSKASYIDKKTQERKNRVVPIFGGAGRLKPNEIPNFGEGSIVRVAFSPSGFCNAALGAGVSLRLESLKLIKPVEFTGGAGSNPFGDDDEAYVPDSSDDGDNIYGDDNDQGQDAEGSPVDESDIDF